MSRIIYRDKVRKKKRIKLDNYPDAKKQGLAESALLRSHPPDCMHWFSASYKKHKIKSDKFNWAMGYYASAVLNHKAKYAIMLDNTCSKRIDFYNNMKYRVFLVSAYDNEAFDVNMDELIVYRLNKGVYK